MPDFVGITQRIDDHAAALNIGIHRRVRVPGKPVGKAGQIHIVDEIGIERQFGKLWGGAGCIRRKVGQDDGVRRAAKLPYLCPFFVVQADVVFWRAAPLVWAVGQIIENIGEIGHGNLRQMAVLLKLFGADLVLSEIAEQRAADKGSAFDLHGFARAQTRFVAQLQAHIAHVFIIIIVIAQHKGIGLARLVAGCLELPHGDQAVTEIAGVGNHIGFGMKGIGTAVGVGKELDFHGDAFSGSPNGIWETICLYCIIPVPNHSDELLPVLTLIVHNIRKPSYADTHRPTQLHLRYPFGMVVRQTRAAANRCAGRNLPPPVPLQ